MDMDVGDDLILGWDWISSHDLGHLFQTGKVDLRSGPAQLQLDLLPAAARPPRASLATVIGHGELRRLLRQVDRGEPTEDTAPPLVAPPVLSATHSSGWSRPVQADHAELAALEAAERQAARARRRHGGPNGRPPPHCGRCVGGVEILRDGTELHLTSFCASPMRSYVWTATTIRLSLPSRPSTRMSWAARRQDCLRTAVWSLSSRRATR